MSGPELTASRAAIESSRSSAGGERNGLQLCGRRRFDLDAGSRTAESRVFVFFSYLSPRSPVEAKAQRGRRCASVISHDPTCC